MLWGDLNMRLEGMAVTVTLVFADVAQRELWLEKNGWLQERDQRHEFGLRRSDSNVIYRVGVEYKETPAEPLVRDVCPVCSMTTRYDSQGTRYPISCNTDTHPGEAVKHDGCWWHIARFPNGVTLTGSGDVRFNGQPDSARPRSC